MRQDRVGLLVHRVLLGQELQAQAGRQALVVQLVREQLDLLDHRVLQVRLE